MAIEKGDLVIGDIVLTARAAALSPHLARLANNGRLGLDMRIAAATAAETMAVALAQPRVSDPLAVFCRRLMLRRECQAAGEMYDQEVRAEKNARGFKVIDQPRWAREPDEQLTPEQIAAKNALAIRRLQDTNAVLRAIDGGLPAKMVLLCFDRRPWSPYDEGKLRHGLIMLMGHYALLDEYHKNEPT